MKFITLDVSLSQSTFNESEDGTISSQCIAWFSVEGNPYSKKSSPDQWGGFVEGVRIPFSAKSKDIDVIKEAATEAANSYREKNYPNT